MLNEITVVFHNDSNYDYHFIIKELENEFEGKFEYLCENTENYKTFSIPIEKEVIEIDNGNESVTTMSYEIKFIDSARFMATLLSNLVDNLLCLKNHKLDLVNFLSAPGLAWQGA